MEEEEVIDGAVQGPDTEQKAQQRSESQEALDRDAEIKERQAQLDRVKAGSRTFQALQTSYAMFQEEGYNGGFEEYFELLCKNPDALQTAFTMFQEEGYNGDFDGFKKLVGVEEVQKKNPGDTSDSDSSVTSVDSPTDPNIQSKISDDNQKSLNAGTFTSFKELWENMPTAEEYYSDSVRPEITQLEPMPDKKDKSFIQSVVNRLNLPGFGKETESFVTLKDRGISKDEMERREKRKADFEAYQKGEKELDFMTNLSNNLTQQMGYLAGTDDRHKFAYAVMYQDLDALQASALELDRIENYAKPVYTPEDFFKDDEKSIGKFGQAVTTGLSGFLGSAVIGGLSFGYGLYTDFAASQIYNYNRREAEAKGISLEEQITNGDTDILVPATIGILQGVLEKFQLNRISRGINAVGNKAMKRVINFFAGVGKNGAEEFGQESLEIVSEHIADADAKDDFSDVELDDMGKSIAKEMFSWRTANAFLLGAFGSGAATISGSAAKSAFTMLKTKEQEDQDEKNVEKLADIERIRSTKKLNKDEKAALKIAEERVKAELKRNQELVSDKVMQMTDAELEQTQRLYHKDKDLNSRIEGVQNSKTFSEEEKKTYIDELLVEKKKIADEITQIEDAIKTREPQNAQVVAAPYFDLEVNNATEASRVRSSKNYQENIARLTSLATDMGIRVEVVDKTIGGYEHEGRGAVQEVSTVFNVMSTDMDKIADFAAIAATQTAAVQDATIAARYTEEGAEGHNADEWTIKVDDVDATLEALKEVGITEFTLNEDQGTVSFLDLHKFPDAELDSKTDKLIDVLNSKGVSYEGKTKTAVESRYIDRKERKQILQAIRQRLEQQGQKGTGLYRQVEDALTKNEIFLEKRFPEESNIRSTADKKKYKFAQTDDPKTLAELKDRTLDPRKRDLIEQAEKAAKAFETVAPDAVIRLHETKQSYAASVGGRAGRTSMGAYNRKTNIIHISLKDADPSTVGHEVFHLLLRRKFSDDKQIQAATKELFDTLKEQVGGKTKEAIEQLVSNYKENQKDEERIVELFGLMSSNQTDIPKTSVQAIKLWVNKVAKLLGIGKLFTGRDVGRAEQIDIFKRLATKVATAEQLTDVDIHSISEAQDQTEVNSEDIVRPKIIDDDDTIAKRTVGPFDIQYFNETERFQKLIDEGRLITHVDSSFIPEGAQVVVHSPDNMFVGDIYHRGEKIINGEGGLFYTLNTDNVWASTEQNLTSLVNTINKAVKASPDGKAFMMLVGGSNSKMLGNITASSAALQVLNKMPEKNIFARGDLRKILADVGKERGIDIPPKFSVERMIQHIDKTFLATEKPSFDERRSFIQDIVKRIGELEGVKNDKVANQKFREFFGMSDMSKLSKTGFTNNLANLLTEPLLQGLPSGHAYAAIEINGPVEGFVERSHRAYAGAVKQKEGVPTLHLFDKRQNIDELVDTVDGLSKDAETKPGEFRGKIGLAQAGLGIGVIKQSIDEAVSAKMTPEEGKRADRSDKGWKEVTEEGKRLLSPPKRSLKQRFKEGINNFMTNWMDRQFDVKKKLLKTKDATAKEVYNRLITAAGASASAKNVFRQFDKLIYGKLSEKNKEALDRIIAERRLIAIEENISKRKKNLKNAKNLTEGYKRGRQGLTADDARAALKRMREQLGEDTYNDLNNRADVYFQAMSDQLKRLYEGGRITEKMYLNLRDIEYSPIRTIKFMLQENQDLYSQDSIDAQAEKYGMTAEDIKALTEANEDAYVQDSRWLLRTQIAVTEKKFFQNSLLNQVGKLVDEGKAEGLGITRLVPGMPGNPVSNKAFLSKKGLAEVKYKVDGEDATLYMPVDMARQILDIDPEPNVTARYRKAGKFTGSNLLRFQATGGNLTFFVRNVPMDYLNVLFFTDAYGKFKLLSGAQLAIDGIVNATKATLKTKGFKENYNEFLKYGGGLDFLGVDGIAKIEEAKIVRGLKTAQQKAGYYFVKGLSHFNEIAELTFRLSVYNKTKNDLISEYKKANDGGTPQGDALNSILFEAAAKARASIDFAQGGIKARRLDKFFPYFNPAMQSTRRVLDMAQQKPVEFVSNITQAGLMSAGVVAGMGMLMGYLMGTDDEDEIKEKIKDFRQGLSKYEKSNYFTYPVGINADGSVKYVRIRKLPILSIPITLAEEVAYKRIWGIDMDDSALAESVLSSAPILPSNLLSRNPAISAAFALGGYDTFRREMIFKDPDPYNPIPASKQGIHSEYVNELFKVTGDITGLSPMNTQRAAEKLFTNPNTNPLVGLAYAGFEAGLSENTELNQRMKQGMEDFKKATSKAVVRNSNPDLQKYAQREVINKEIQEILGSKYERDQKYKRKVRDLLKEKPGTRRLPEDLRMEILKDFGRDDYIRARDKYTKYLTLKNGDGRIIDIGFQRDPDVAAKLIMSGYGVMDPEVFRDFDMKVKSYTGKRLSKRTKIAYGKLVRDAGGIK